MAAWALPDDSGNAELEAAAIRLLAAGKEPELRRLLAAQPRPSLLGDVADADLRSRRLQADLPDLQALDARLAAAPDASPTLRWWLGAVIAERLAQEADLECAVWASKLLGEVPGDPMAPAVVIYTRARLRRVAAIMWLADATPGGVRTFESLRDDAINDFLRCGFGEEAAMTRVITGCLRWLVTWEDPWGALAELEQLRWRFPNARATSMWPAFENFRGLTAFACGDMWTAHQAFDAMAAAPEAHPVASALVRFGRALAGLVGDGGHERSLPPVEEAVRLVGRLAPRYASMYGKIAAEALADFDRPDLARPLTHSEIPPLGGIDRLEVRMVGVRLDVLDGRPPEADVVWGILRGLEGYGHVRKAGVLALRLAGDLRLREDDALAEELRAWAIERLPDRRDRWTLWELAWDRRSRARATVAPAPAAAAVSIRVLQPVLELDRRGDPVAVRATVAKLLLALVEAHPRPVHAEEVADLLWPGEPLDEVRGRLDSLVHRLRQALGEAAAFVSRADGRLALVPSAAAVDVDLFRLRAAMADPAGAEGAKLAQVGGNLCEAQFPYDEVLVDGRHRLAGAWLAAARRAVAAGAPVDDLGPAARALGVDGQLA